MGKKTAAVCGNEWFTWN